MPTSHDLTKLTAAHPHAQQEATFPIKTVKATLDASQVNLSAGDDAKLINVDAGQALLHLAYRLRTAEGSAVTLDIGDAAGASSLVSNLNGNASPGVTLASFASGSKMYTADDVIKVTSDGTAAHLQLDIFATLIDYT